MNENCTSPITGNVYCDPSSLTLAASYGFSEYYWYTSDFSRLLGTSNTLTFTPAPPANTTFAVRIVPYPGLGCPDTLYTTIKEGESITNFNVVPSLRECFPKPIDLTAASVTAGSQQGLKYTYFTDAQTTTFVREPKAVTESGMYYIKATNASGCVQIKSVQVLLNSVSLTITDPPSVCAPGSIDITLAAVTFGSDNGLVYTYWKDAKATVVLTNPNSINLSGIYY